MNHTEQSLSAHYLEDTRQRMRDLKRLGENALNQLPDGQWHTLLAPEGNSVAVIIQHLAGNMQSRWGAYQHGFTPAAEGETGTRNRDAEFMEGEQTPGQLLIRWHEGWQVYLDALDHLAPEDLTQELTIRAETHTVLQAIQRQVMHYSGHVYQLILIVKTLRGSEWRTLSIPRGGSAAFNAQKMGEVRE